MLHALKMSVELHDAAFKKGKTLKDGVAAVHHVIIQRHKQKTGIPADRSHAMFVKGRDTGRAPARQLHELRRPSGGVKYGNRHDTLSITGTSQDFRAGTAQFRQTRRRTFRQFRVPLSKKRHGGARKRTTHRTAATTALAQKKAGVQACGPLSGTKKGLPKQALLAWDTARNYASSPPLSSMRNLRERRNTTTLRGGRVMDSSVCGLRPLRAFLS